jgi:hypothetical protein
MRLLCFGGAFKHYFLAFSIFQSDFGSFTAALIPKQCLYHQRRADSKPLATASGSVLAMSEYLK